MSVSFLVFQLIILLFSVVIHEVSHGFTAEKLGDDTARRAGRLTLNPLKHLDPFGSVLLPLFLFFVSQGSFIFGWAKPVPYNPLNLKNLKRGAGIIGVAGPLSNLIIASVFAVFYRLALSAGVSPALLQLFSFIVLINIVLAIFNLVPLPPLDGSKVLFAVMPNSWFKLQIFLEKYGILLLLFFIFFGFQLIIPLMLFVYKLLVGNIPML